MSYQLVPSPAKQSLERGMDKEVDDGRLKPASLQAFT